MSPALKSKAKNKSSTSAVKEQPKVPSKPSSAGNGGNVPPNAYNPILGTFHTLEAGQPATSTSQNNGRFVHIDEIENRYGNYPGNVAECDSISNNDSCSGESEDQKDKLTAPNTTSQRPEPIPGCDNDKREKIRQKNEKKHQRQKERRAQELHERCTGFLMSRKFDFLTEKLVGMGFAVEHATRALMLNDGRAEDSVSWLLEGGMDEEPDSSKSESRANLKIDISDELAKIAVLEIKFKCTKQEVERAVVSCEGDLEKTEEILKAQKQEQAATPKTAKSGDTIASNGTTKVTSTSQNAISRATGKLATSVTIQQTKRDERDLNHTKNVTSAATLPDLQSRMLQPSMKMQPKMDWLKNVAVQNDRRLPSMGPSTSVSYPLSFPLQVVTPAKVEVHQAIVGNEGRTNFQAGTLKEPVIMMQRPKSVNVSSNLPSTSVGVSGLPQLTMGWNSNGVPSVDMVRDTEGGRQKFLTASKFLSSNQPFYQNNQTWHYVSASEANGWGGGSWSHGRSSNGPSSLTTPSSLGLFTGWNLVGSPRSSTVDWSMIGSTMPEFDYTSIDWSMDLSSSMVDSSTSLRTDRPYDSWPTTFAGARSVAPNMTSSGMPLELVEGASMLPMDPSPYIGSREWTSPFAGKDIFRLPRQFVSSPSL